MRLIVLKKELMTGAKRKPDGTFGKGTQLSLDISVYVPVGWGGRVNWIESCIFTAKALWKSC